MTTENEVPEGVEVVEPVVEEQAPEQSTAPAKEPETPASPDPTEADARALGWLPKAEFDANPANAGKKWRSAETFMDLVPIFDKIDQLHKTNKSLSQGMKALAEHNRKVEVAAYNRAKAELLSQRKEALAEQDFVKAEEIRDQLDAMSPPQPIPVPEVPAEPPPQFQEWRNRNRWYDTNEDARLFADTYGVKLASQGMHPDTVLQRVEEKVKTTFPQLFTNPNRNNAPAVESGGRNKQSSGFQMTREEVDIMNKLIASGAPISKEEYISQLKKIRGA
jgi:hypothetical protein